MRGAVGLCVVVGAVGLSVAPRPSGAQTPPPAAEASPVDPTVDELRSAAPEAQRAVLDEALRALLSGSARDAMVTLTVLAQRDGVDLRGYSTVAVTLRLAAAIATGQRLPARARPSAAPTAPGVLPPPPSDVETVARIIDGTLELLAGGQHTAARALLESGIAGREAFLAPYMPLAAVRLYVQSGGAPGPRGPGAQPNPAGPPMGEGGPGMMGAPGMMIPAPDRPPGTLDSSEALALYVAGGTAGLVGGIYLASLVPERNAGLLATLPFLGLAGGLVGSALLDRGHSIRRGRGYATNAGVMLGLMGSMSLTLAADWDFASTESRNGAHAMFFGMALGGVAGYGIAVATDALPGSGSLVLSLGAMGWYLGLMGGLGFEAPDTKAFTASLVGEGLGVALGAILASSIQPTPAQMRWFDLGGLLGGMVGASFGSGFRDDTSIPIASATGALLGASLGLFLGAPTPAERAAYRRRLGRGPTFSPRLGAMPLPGGGVLTLNL